MLKEDIKRI